MPRGRIKRQPSGRNLELYHELVCEGRPRSQVAARFRISLPRVTQIRHEVAGWIDATLPPGRADRCEPGRRLHVAVALRRLQLHKTYGKYLAQFGGGRGAEGLAHLRAARQLGVLPRTTRLPSRDYVQSAMRMARELDDLDRTLRRGPLAEQCARLERG